MSVVRGAKASAPVGTWCAARWRWLISHFDSAPNFRIGVRIMAGRVIPSGPTPLARRVTGDDLRQAPRRQLMKTQA